MGKLQEDIEQGFLDIINGKRHTKKDVAIRIVLFALSRLFRIITQFRLWLYEHRIIRNKSIGCLVVSIGNLSCGGTGKTPVVEIFAKTLSKQNRKVAILSRGYRSKDNRTFIEKLKARLFQEEHYIPPRVVSDGKNLLLNSLNAGDEPYMLASNLKNVAVLVDKDRVKSGLYAIKNFQTDTILLDDGFQYLGLHSHINILLIDSTSPFHNHYVLPRGLLREPIKNIRRADYIFLTKSNGGNQIRHLKSFVRKHNRQAEIIECCHKPQYLEKVYHRGVKEDLSYLKGKKIAALSAIAYPKSFEDFLEKLGSTIVYRKSYADHHRFVEQEMIDFINTAKDKGAEIILTTEKDAVRMPRVNRRDIEVYFLRVEIDILAGYGNFEQAISRICFL